MKALLLILLLIAFICVGAWKIFLFALNIAGMPGAFVAGTPNKGKFNCAMVRFLIGWIIAMAGQSYLYLAYVAIIVSFIHQRAPSASVFAYVIWPLAFIASFVPIYLCTAAAIFEASEGKSEWTANVGAVRITELLAAIMFFMFAFFPHLIELGWPWIKDVPV